LLPLLHTTNKTRDQKRTQNLVGVVPVLLVVQLFLVRFFLFFFFFFFLFFFTRSQDTSRIAQLLALATLQAWFVFLGFTVVLPEHDEWLLQQW
jgi:hypothetical protein